MRRAYNARGRLTDVTKDGGVRHYDYDSNGNRTGATEGATSLTGDYDGQDRVLSYGSAIFEHNAMGQRISKTAGSDTTTYGYDELGNLVSVGLAAKSVSYVVDGLNRRVTRKVDGTVTNRYLYGQGLLPIAELNSDGSVKARFVFASKAHVPDYMVKGGVTYRFVTDQIGSVRLVVNTSDGTVAQRIDYDPFGGGHERLQPRLQAIRLRRGPLRPRHRPGALRGARLRRRDGALDGLDLGEPGSNPPENG